MSQVQEEEDMVLEQGELEDTVHLDQETARIYYSLQAEETLESQIESQNFLPEIPGFNENFQLEMPRSTENLREPRRSLPRIPNSNPRHTQLMFSPEGNEGFMFTNFSSDDRESTHNTPREISEEILIKRYNYPHSNQDLRYTGDNAASRANPLDRIESKITSVRSAFNALRLTPRDNFSEAPLEESFNSAESVASPRSGGYLTDRATSPSAASVASIQSVSSQVSVSGRRFLEWDYGSDLGYVEGQQTQIEAAQSLSTLEKLAIGNYSEFLKDAGEDKRNYKQRFSIPRDPPLDSFGEDNTDKINKFAESLMRQRQLREQELARQERRSRSKDRQDRRSRSKDRQTGSYRHRSREGRRLELDTAGYEADPRHREQGAYSLPHIATAPSDKSNSETGSSPEKYKLKRKTKMRRSSSLTEFSDIINHKDGDKRFLSNSQLSQVQSRLNQFSGPSSSSSGGTVVSNKKKLNSSRYPEQEPLPSHLEDIVIETEPDLDRNIFSSQISKLSAHSRQSSRRSISNSFETVIAATGNGSSAKNSIDTEDDLHNSDADRGAAETLTWRGRPVPQAWSAKSSSERELGVSVSAGIPYSRNSSLPSTSDEDDRRKRREPRETGGDTSTLDSVQMIDRAKSFEYIPGESFPLQENSSSYEYLPGHLVPEQRPPTVLNLAPECTLAGAADTGNSSLDSRTENKTSSANLDLLTLELRDKSKELLAANLSQTKHFFKKLKRYIDFISTPSETLAECRIKQDLATKISKLLETEESRLEHSSDLSRPESSVSEVSLAVGGADPKVNTLMAPPAPRYKPRQRQESEHSSLHSIEQHRRSWKTSRTKSEEKFEKNSQRSIDNVDELNKKRLEHMRILKRELKILERLELKYSGEDVSTNTTASSGHLQLLDSPTRKLTYVKSSRTGNNSTTITDNLPFSKDTVDKYTGVEPVSRTEKGVQVDKVQSDNSSRVSFRSESSQSSVKKSLRSCQDHILSHTETIEVHAKFESHTEESLMGAPSRDASESDLSTSKQSSSFVSSSGASEFFFRQTSQWNKENKRRHKDKKTGRSKGRSPRRDKAVAYYLPLENLSPIRIGKRVLKDSADNEQSAMHSFRTRNILSKYMSTISTEPVRPRVTITSRPREESRARCKLSLQEALRHKRPDFVQNSERRVQVLRQIRQVRERREEKHRAWLEELRSLSPNSRKEARPVFSPSPVVRLFTHREMVSAARTKYSVLPEVVHLKDVTKKEGRNETNRLRAEIYSRQLKRKLRQGKVSLSHHDRVF